jgi:hypothetical protein
VRAAPAIVVSAMAHVGVLAWLATDTDEPSRPFVLEIPRPRAVSASEPIEIVMLEPAPQAYVAPRVRRGGEYAIAAHATMASAAHAGHEAAGTDATTGFLRMRRTGTGDGPTTSAELRLDPHSREEIREHAHAQHGDGPAAENPVSETPLLDPRALKFEKFSINPYPKQERSGFSTELQPLPGRGAIIYDRVTTLTMEPDGNVKLDDKPDIDIKLKLPVPDLDIEKMRRDVGKLLTEWYRDPYAATRFGPTSEVARHLTAVPGACDAWGDVMCADPLAPAQEQDARDKKGTGGAMLGLAGPMDITAWLHRKFVGDPYASRKLKLLDGTRDARIARGGAYRKEQLERSAELMTRTLEELWRSTSDPALRKQALFELWDDCEEGEGPRGEAGARARAIVLGWIRGKLPAGAPDAYTTEEIKAFTARQASKEPFTPY